MVFIGWMLFVSLLTFEEAQTLNKIETSNYEQMPIHSVRKKTVYIISLPGFWEERATFLNCARGTEAYVDFLQETHL